MEGYDFSLAEDIIIIQLFKDSLKSNIKKGKDCQSLPSNGKFVPNTYPIKKVSSATVAKVRTIIIITIL